MPRDKSILRITTLLAVAVLIAAQSFSVLAADGWKLDKSKAKFGQLEKSEQAVFDRFQNAVKKGMHPKEAAKQAGDTNYKKLSGDQYQIRLGGKQRATFIVDEAKKVCTIKQVGGHTK